MSLSLRGGTGRGPRTSSCSHDKPQGDAARDEELEQRCRRDQLREQRRGLRQMLEAVEHEQDRAAAEVLAKRRQVVADTRGRSTERAPDRADDGCRIRDGVERHECRPVDKVRRQPPSRLDRHASLSRTSRAGDGQQADVVAPERGADVFELRLTADQSIRRRRELGPVDLRARPGPASHPVSGSPARAASAWGRARSPPAPGAPCAPLWYTSSASGCRPAR